MKKILTFAVLLGVTLFVPVQAGIVNNSGTSSEDSISLAVVNCDSLGNPATADSFYVFVMGPSGDSLFGEAITAAGSNRLDSSRIGGQTVYRYHAAVADIDGPGWPGLYRLVIVARKLVPDLRWLSITSFQVVDWELDNVGDSIGLAGRASREAVDSLKSQFGWVSRFDGDFDLPTMAMNLADTLHGRDSLVFDEGFWHRLAQRADSGAISSGADSTSIARWVWNTPAAQHTLDGTFGGHLDADMSGLGSGTGAYSCTFVTVDSMSGRPLPGVGVAVRNLSQAAVLGVGRTNLDGAVSFNLDAGSYIVVAGAIGYQFAPFDTVAVTGALRDTVAGTRFEPAAPTAPELCRVYGFVISPGGLPEVGVDVTASLGGTGVRHNGAIVSPLVLSTVTDTAGYFALDVIPSDHLMPTGTAYEFTFRRDSGDIARTRLQVPDLPLWQLSW